MPAVVYSKSAFDPTPGPNLVGLRVANRQFLDALLRHPGIEELVCYVSSQEDYESFVEHAKPVKAPDMRIVPVALGDHRGLSRAGVLHRYDPAIAQHVWQRRYHDDRLYGVSGIVHSASEQRAMEVLGDLVVAPTQAWDALVCTSSAVQASIRGMMESWVSHLARRFNAKPNLQINLPLIPLGVDCRRFDGVAKDRAGRIRLRTELGVGDGDIVVLYVGRLTYQRKCHPVPMYLALQRAHDATGARIHFVQAGDFEHTADEAAFREAAARFCPDVRVVILGGRATHRADPVWSAADIFLSLSDSIQETFGLAPIEAMAAGLPCVVSDWDGYRDTVRDGLDGNLIPTFIPPPGTAERLAARYQEFGNFRAYYGDTAIHTAVDVAACAEALVRLISSAELRHRLGANAAERARVKFDWPVVINAYRDLWAHLDEIRIKARCDGPAPAATHPLCDDPFRTFRNYASAALTPDMLVSIDGATQSDLVTELAELPMTAAGAEWRGGNQGAGKVFEAVRKQGPIRLGALVAATGLSSDDVHLGAAYLLKFGLLRLHR